MSQQADGVYVQGAFSEPVNSQHHFSNHFNLERPQAAMSLYSRIIHQHTRQQLDMATNSARRRSQGDNASVNSGSSLGSIGSNGS